MAAEAGSGEVLSFLVSWPKVRCDNCHEIYTVAVDDATRFNLIVGSCPRCGHQRFSTTMKSGGLVEDAS